MRSAEHDLFVPCVGIPEFLSFPINRAEFPLLEGIFLTCPESTHLFLFRNREPEFDQGNPVFEEHVFKSRHLPHETLILLLRAEAIDRLHDGAVVPAPIKKHRLARVG